MADEKAVVTNEPELQEEETKAIEEYSTKELIGALGGKAKAGAKKVWNKVKKPVIIGGTIVGATLLYENFKDKPQLEAPGNDEYSDEGYTIDADVSEAEDGTVVADAETNAEA